MTPEGHDVKDYSMLEQSRN